MSELPENAYTFRVDDLPLMDTKGVITDFLSSYKKYIIFEEISEKKGKLHYQGVVFTTQSFNTYRTYANKYFSEWKGGNRRSFAKVKDIEHYIPYIYKGGNCFIRVGISDEDHYINQERSNSITNEIIEKQKAKSSKSFVQRIISDYSDWRITVEKAQLLGVSQYYVGDSYVKNDKFHVNRYEVCKWVLEYFRDNCKIFDAFIIAKFVNLIRITFEEDVNEFMNSCLEKCL